TRASTSVSVRRRWRTCFGSTSRPGSRSRAAETCRRARPPRGAGPLPAEIVMRSVASPTADCIDALAALPRLGVGLLYNAALPGFLASELDAVDYVELIPDMFWRLQPSPQGRRYEEIRPS